MVGRTKGQRGNRRKKGAEKRDSGYSLANARIGLANVRCAGMIRVSEARKWSGNGEESMVRKKKQRLECLFRRMVESR